MEEVKKKRRKKRTLTPEQKQAAAERLAAAREKKPVAELKTVHDSVKALAPDHPLCVENVKKWIKTNKEKLPALKNAVRRNEKGALAELLSTEAYIRNMQNYLKEGIWLDLFYGENQETRMGYRVIAPAYYHEGEMKGIRKPIN